MKLLKSLLSAAAAVCLAAVPLSSQAGPISLTIDDLAGHTLTITAPSMTTGNDQAVYINPNFYGWDLKIYGTGANYNPNVPYGIDLFSFNATSSGALDLKVTLSEDGLNFGVAGPKGVRGSIGGTLDAGASISYSMYADTTNALNSSPLAGLVFTGSAATGGGFADNGSATVALGNPFSMTMFTTLHHSQGGLTTYDFRGIVPEPASIALVGLALLGLGAATRRKA